MKRIIRLTESDLHRIIKESVKRILREEDFGSMVGGSDMGGDIGSSMIEDDIDEEGEGGVGDFTYDAPAFIDKKTARRNNLCNFGEIGKGAV